MMGISLLFVQNKTVVPLATCTLGKIFVPGKKNTSLELVSFQFSRVDTIHIILRNM